MYPPVSPPASPPSDYDGVTAALPVLPGSDGNPPPAADPTAIAAMQDLAPPPIPLPLEAVTADPAPLEAVTAEPAPLEAVTAEPAALASDVLSPPGPDPSASLDEVEGAKTVTVKYRRSRRNTDRIANEYIITLIDEPEVNVASTSFE